MDNENSIPTIEEIFKRRNPQDGTCPQWAKELAIETAEQYVQVALRKAAEKVTHKHKVYDTTFIIDKQSILGAFPIENIK